MKMRTFWLAQWVSVLVMTSGCGGDDDPSADLDYKPSIVDPATCNDFSACGGDLDGEWALTGAVFCNDPAELLVTSFGQSPACRDTLADLELPVRGYLKVDGSHCAIEMYFYAAVTIAISSACVAALGGPPSMGQACAELNAEFSQSAATDSEMASGYCSLSGGDCRCTVITQERQAAESGLCNSDLPSHACRQGDALELLSPPSSSTPMQFLFQLARSSEGSATSSLRAMPRSETPSADTPTARALAGPSARLYGALRSMVRWPGASWINSEEGF